VNADTLAWWTLLRNVAGRWTVSHDWAHWHAELVWMTACFSVAVRVSVARVLVPRLRPTA
jgi:hypothetical protein